MKLLSTSQAVPVVPTLSKRGTKTSASVRPNPTCPKVSTSAILKVKRLYAAVLAHGHDSCAKALQIGDVLTGIKESLEHGQWLPWLSTNLPEITPRTVQNCMRVWKNRELIKNESNSYLVENLTAALGAISKQEKNSTGTADNGIDADLAKGSSKRSHKRELLRGLGDAFIAGLETEEVKARLTW